MNVDQYPSPACEPKVEATYRAHIRCCRRYGEVPLRRRQLDTILQANFCSEMPVKVRSDNGYLFVNTVTGHTDFTSDFRYRPKGGDYLMVPKHFA